MKNYFLEYIWLDGNSPQKLRAKTKVVSLSQELNLTNWKNFVKRWNYDGSSTNQAETSKSELILNPVNLFKDPFRQNSFLVMCEVLNVDGTPHSTNKRNQLEAVCDDLDDETMYGFEQEYILYNKSTRKPVGWPSEGFPRPQGDYYCSVGSDNVDGRDFVEEHMSLCLEAGLSFTGINAEVMLGQWEYQIGPVYALDGSDQLWISRYIMERLSEKYGYYVELHPKPYVGNDWNGSGMHVNFSTKEMREDLKNKEELVIEACKKLGENISKHIEVYGIDNHLRLTGANETCSINQFKFGIGDRTASIRIPYSIQDSTTPGYLEDRRPASNADPYEICKVMIETICGVMVETI